MTGNVNQTPPMPGEQAMTNGAMPPQGGVPPEMAQGY
jgi:hypothetical protein